MEQALRRPVSDGAILTRSLEHLLRAVIRLIVGKLSLVRLEELVRKIYVQESEKRLKLDFPDKRVTLSQLALLTGVDTRALTKITNSQTFSQPAHEDESFLRGMTPETQIISFWLTDTRFCNPSNGKPKELSLGQSNSGFAQLVSCLGSTRGLTHQSILERLEMAETVEVDHKRQRVKLVTKNFYPFISNDESAMLDVGLWTASLLLGTVASNVERANSGEEKLFQRSSFTYHLPLRRKEKFRKQLTGLLTQSDGKCRTAIANLEDETPQPGQSFGGVSLFYFESEGTD